MAKQPQPIVEQLRDAIRQAERRGVTQYQIAKAARVHQSQLTRFMAGETIPRLQTAERLIAAIGGRLLIQIP